jgi:hypothetical protein
LRERGECESAEKNEDEGFHNEMILVFRRRDVIANTAGVASMANQKTLTAEFAEDARRARRRST